LRASRIPGIGYLRVEKGRGQVVDHGDAARFARPYHHHDEQKEQDLHLATVQIARLILSGEIEEPNADELRLLGQQVRDGQQDVHPVVGLGQQRQLLLPRHR